MAPLIIDRMNAVLDKSELEVRTMLEDAEQIATDLAVFFGATAENDGNISKVDLGNQTFTDREWFMTCKETGANYYTETYVDDTMGILMTSFVTPVFDNNGQFIGVINADIDMSPIQAMVDAIKIGNTGSAKFTIRM